MTNNALDLARAVPRPTRDAMLRRSPSVYQFWQENRELFTEAWVEWEEERPKTPSPLDRTLYDPQLRQTVEASWENPDLEDEVAKLWKQVLPGVYEAQFFDPKKLKLLRDYLDDVSHADIPLRPPYGIVLNRGGAMLDARSEGYLAAPVFQSFYQDLMDTFMRPVSRLLFPEVTGYDTQTFGFSIQWQADKDTSLRPHTDASAVTLNINLNLPDEEYSGSAVNFYDQQTGQQSEFFFKPGSAVIHRGYVPHASQPITQGERSNFVLWLFGAQGQTPPPYTKAQPVDARERWKTPPSAPDGFAPF